ncbi:MAG: extensin family protein [Flavobacteriaceae bacterium]
MGRTILKHGALALVLGVLLSACSGPSFNMFGGQSRDEVERNRWRDEAEMQCLGLKGAMVTAFVDRKEPIDGPGVCGIRQPFALSSIGMGLADIKPAATLNCQMVVAVQHWLRTVVQPAALIRFGQPVVEVKNIASYGCRTRNNERGAKLSEHSFGNALDVAAFKLAGGREISVKDGWDSFFGISREAGFLRAVHRESCDIFTTVLGPESDRHHQDHLHLDLARHNAQGTHYCK